MTKAEAFKLCVAANMGQGVEVELTPDSTMADRVTYRLIREPWGICYMFVEKIPMAGKSYRLCFYVGNLPTVVNYLTRHHVRRV